MFYHKFSFNIIRHDDIGIYTSETAPEQIHIVTSGEAMYILLPGASFEEIITPHDQKVI